MRKVRYFLTINGTLKPLDATDTLITKLKWHKDETLKVEVWPFDLKIGPCTQIPYGTQKQSKQESIKEIIRLNAEYRRKKNERNNQKPLIRLNKTSTPYSEEFTKRDDARNRAYLSKEISKRRQDSEEPPPQDDAPF